MKKMLALSIVLVVLCGCSSFQQTVSIGPATGAEASLIAAQFICYSSPQGAIAGAAVGAVAGMVIADQNERKEYAEKAELEEDN